MPETLTPTKPTKASKAYLKIYQHYANLNSLFANPDYELTPTELRDRFNKLEATARAARQLYLKDAEGMLEFDEGDQWPVDFTRPYWEGKAEKLRVVDDLFKPSVAAALGWDDFSLIPGGPDLTLDWANGWVAGAHLLLSCTFHSRQGPQYRRLVRDEYDDIVLAPRMIDLKL